MIKFLLKSILLFTCVVFCSLFDSFNIEHKYKMRLINYNERNIETFSLSISSFTDYKLI